MEDHLLPWFITSSQTSVNIPNETHIHSSNLKAFSRVSPNRKIPLPFKPKQCEQASGFSCMYNLGPALWSFEAVLPDLCDGWIQQMQCLAKTTCEWRFLVDALVINPWSTGIQISSGVLGWAHSQPAIGLFWHQGCESEQTRSNSSPPAMRWSKMNSDWSRDLAKVTQGTGVAVSWNLGSWIFPTTTKTFPAPLGKRLGLFRPR